MSTQILPDSYGRDIRLLNNILKILLVIAYVIANCFSSAVVPKSAVTGLQVFVYLSVPGD